MLQQVDRSNSSPGGNPNHLQISGCDPYVSRMASGPLVGGGGNGNDGSREKHRWADASKVYTRKSFNKGSKSSSNLNTKPPPNSSNQSLAGATAGEGVDTSLHQQIQPHTPPAAASDDDSSSLNRRPNTSQSKSNTANGQRRLVTISLASRSKHEVRDLRRKLTAELDQVRAIYRKFESREHHQGAAFGTALQTPSQFSASDAALATPVASKRGPPHTAATNSEAGSNAPLRRQLSLSVPENSVGEKEKRTPKANQYYRNSDFVLGKEKLPPADSHGYKKSKSMAVVDNRQYSQAFKSCSSLLSKIMKHKHGWVFNTPVDVKGLGLHDYHIIIKRPMDLGTVKSRLSKNWYKTPEEFAEDVRLTFRNAMTYNPKGQDVHVMAEQLLQMFEQQWPAIEAEYSYLSSPRPPTVSSKRPPPIDMGRVLERSDSTVQPMSVDSKTKPVSYTPHVGRPPALKKPKAKDPHKRDMTFEEKQKLSNNLQNLPPEKLDNVVQIIKKRNSSLSQHDDEIEVDIDSVDTETLWELDRFVTNYKKSLSKNKRKAELALHIRSDNHPNAAQETVHERSSDPVVAEVSKESKTVVDQKNMASSPPRGGEAKMDNVNRSSSSSSSSSDSGSSSSDSDSESSSAGSDAGQSPRT